MDNYTFMSQLHKLNDRVNALTVQYSPSAEHIMPAVHPSPPSSSADAFSAQLSELKDHVDSLQASLAQCTAGMQQPRSRSMYTLPPMPNTSPGQQPLPSAEYLLQAFTSLRTEVLSLGDRLADSEQCIESLEDRFDHLDPDRFTPAASTASHDEQSGGVQVTPGSDVDLLSASAADLPELCSEDKKLQTNAPPPASTTGAEHECSQHTRVQSLFSQHSNGPVWQQASTNCTAPQPATSPSWRRYGDSFVPYELCALAQGLQPGPSGEGVAFRDREIDRMDDQLRVVHEHLKTNEASSKAKDVMLAKLRNEVRQYETLGEDARERNLELAETNYSQKSRIQAHELEIKRLRGENETIRRENTRFVEKMCEQDARCQDHLQIVADREHTLRWWDEQFQQEMAAYNSALAQRDQALHAWEESWHHASHTYGQEHERVCEAERMLDECRYDKRESIDQLRADHRREMQKLQDFCEQKDGVIAEQDRVMSRGGRFLQQRDEEIERLQKRARVAEDDLAQLMRQRDGLGSEMAPKKRLTRLPEEMTLDEAGAARERADHVDTSSDVSAVRDVFSSPQQQAQREHDRRLARPRRDRDDSPPRSDKAQRSESREPMTRRSSESPRRRRPNKRSDHRLPYRHGKGPDRQPSPPRLSREVQTMRNAPDRGTRTQPRHHDRRRPHFDDMPSFNPPLSAPVTARKMASEADLRGVGSSRSNGMLPAGQHRSMQDLGGRRMQAYVETEGESEGQV